MVLVTDKSVVDWQTARLGVVEASDLEWPPGYFPTTFKVDGYVMRKCHRIYYAGSNEVAGWAYNCHSSNKIVHVLND